MKGLIIMMVWLFVGAFARAEATIKTDSLPTGIEFVQNRTWNQIVSEAKLEKKYIFVDCFATWCGPCKKMEMEVYPDVRVGEYFNEHFIAVKAQMDTSRNDQGTTKGFYADAAYLRRKYKVNLYPTFLFFNPDGNILSKASGAMTAENLIKVARMTQAPQSDYYALLESYKKGRRNRTEMAFLAHTSSALFGDTAQSEAIATDFIHSLTRAEWFASENISFLREITKTSNDPGFEFFYRNADSINKIMNAENFSQGIVQGIIYTELTSPELARYDRTGETPDWQGLTSRIAQKYDTYYADRIISGVKADWYGRHKQWAEHTKWLVLYVQKYVPTSDSAATWVSVFLNNYAWDVFAHSMNTGELKVALSWSSKALAVEASASCMDTYANILYKLGKRDVALRWEEVAAKLGQNDKVIVSNLELMEAGKPTWDPK